MPIFDLIDRFLPKAGVGPFFSDLFKVLKTCVSAPVIFKEKRWSLMQTGDFYGNVSVVYANRFPSKQKFSGTQHHFKQMCRTASFVDMSSLATLVQQAEAGGRNEKKSAQT